MRDQDCSRGVERLAVGDADAANFPRGLYELQWWDFL